MILERAEVTVQTATVVDFGEGGGWARVDAGGGSVRQSVSIGEANAVAVFRFGSR